MILQDYMRLLTNWNKIVKKQESVLVNSNLYWRTGGRLGMKSRKNCPKCQGEMKPSKLESNKLICKNCNYVFEWYKI